MMISTTFRTTATTPITRAAFASPSRPAPSAHDVNRTSQDRPGQSAERREPEPKDDSSEKANHGKDEADDGETSLSGRLQEPMLR